MNWLAPYLQDEQVGFIALAVIAGALGGLSGFLLANAIEFVSPAYMGWQRSGELIIMVGAP